jgi:hypothetical protein
MKEEKTTLLAEERKGKRDKPISRIILNLQIFIVVE